jgi:putative oxygen-independent coproporphyrinogen III oxidase
VILPDDGLPGFGIYIHWPFCTAKCPYCDFNSHVRHTPPDQERYVRAFERELAYMRERTGNRSVKSIFLGGGTPSLMEPHTVAALLNAVAQLWHVPIDIEITMEANPSSVEASRFHGYRAAGVNRLSMGVQSLDDAELKFLGRLHNAQEAIAAIDLARGIFPRISFDLIYARPNQTLKNWETELNRAIDLAADHLSLYQLTIEDGTPFGKLYASGKLTELSNDRAADLYVATQEITFARGLPAYEVSNHARLGAESRHNLVYWRYGDYVGSGPGAHGRINDNGIRFGTSTELNPEKWLELVEKQNHGVIIEEILTIPQQADEFLLMGLRLVEGIDIARFEQLSGRTLSGVRVAHLTDDGMIEFIGNSRLRATEKGRIVLNRVIEQLAMET